MTFKTDLQRGIEIEMQCLAIIKKHRPSAALIDAHKGYDIWIPETAKSVEVKYDKRSLDTGRWLIEVEMSGKPSALSTSTADFWVFYNGKIWLIIERMELISHILRTDYDLLEVTGAGDINTKLAYFIPHQTMERICKPLR